MDLSRFALSCLLTSALLHGSQAASSLLKKSVRNVHGYCLADAANSATSLRGGPGGFP